jgi:hypothetical protein
MNLSLIYHFRSSKSLNGEWSPASYRAVYFFSEDGFLDSGLLSELAKSVPEANHQELTFLNLDDLRSFALRVCQELRAQDVRLISVQDFNIGVDGATDLKSFQSIFSKFGEVVETEEAPRKKGFLSKFFS